MYQFTRRRFESRLWNEGAGRVALTEDFGGTLRAEGGISREPLTDEIDVVIIAGGFSGLLAGARLREAGISNFRILEAGGDFGGTWYWNRYPGAQCDIESYCYLPLLEELGYTLKEKYSYVNEIFEHSQRIGRAYGL